MNPVIYLDADALRQQLLWGRTVECLLFHGLENGIAIIRFITLQSNASGDSLEMRVWECEDVGNHQYIDLYSFPESNPDEDPPLSTFESVEDALEDARKLGGATDRFTARGGLQAVYQASLDSLP